MFGETIGRPEVIGAILLLTAAGVALLRTGDDDTRQDPREAPGGKGT